MNIYVIWCRSGNRYFVRASYSSDATAKVERLNEHVSSWDVATSLPMNCTILNSWD
jgi:hypothetical protein